MQLTESDEIPETMLAFFRSMPDHAGGANAVAPDDGLIYALGTRSATDPAAADIHEIRHVGTQQLMMGTFSYEGVSGGRRDGRGVYHHFESGNLFDVRDEVDTSDEDEQAARGTRGAVRRLEEGTEVSGDEVADCPEQAKGTGKKAYDGEGNLEAETESGF